MPPSESEIDAADRLLRLEQSHVRVSRELAAATTSVEFLGKQIERLVTVTDSAPSRVTDAMERMEERMEGRFARQDTVLQEQNRTMDRIMEGLNLAAGKVTILENDHRSKKERNDKVVKWIAGIAATVVAGFLLLMFGIK